MTGGLVSVVILVTRVPGNTKCPISVRLYLVYQTQHDEND
jgi:hypothetical protein